MADKPGPRVHRSDSRATRAQARARATPAEQVVRRRRVLMMRVRKDMTFADIGRELGISAKQASADFKACIVKDIDDDLLHHELTERRKTLWDVVAGATADRDWRAVTYALKVLDGILPVERIIAAKDKSWRAEIGKVFESLGGG